MKPITSRLVLVILLLLATRIALFAQVRTSPTISYQAQILNEEGKAMNEASCLIHVEILNIDGPSPIGVWSDDYNVPVTNGILNLNLGDHLPLPSPTELDHKLAVGLSIKGEPMVLTPMSATSFALNVADSSITAAKMGTDYVSSVTIDGMRVTTKGGPLNLQAGNGLQLSYNEDANAVTIGVPEAQIHNGGGSVDYWGESGNTLAGGEWLGSSNSMPLIIEANSRRSIEIVPAAVATDDAPGIEGGYFGNGFGGSTIGAIIAGGGRVGQTNQIWENYGFIGGGAGNTEGEFGAVDDTFLVVGGGLSNWAREDFSAIVGGKTNQALSKFGFIGAGEGNYIEHEDTWASHYSTIGGGHHNRIYDQYSTIAGGDTNVVFRNAPYGTIGGGQGNVIGNPQDTSHDNHLTHSFIGGGYLNSIEASYSTIAGGDTNRILDVGDHSFIGGGRTNEVGGRSSAIVSGDSNWIDPGTGSRVTAFSVIGGGSRNSILHDDADPRWWTLNAVIGGGYRNTVTEFATFIGGGDSNTVLEEFSSVMGGEFNEVDPFYSNIQGGLHNIIDAGQWANISGGRLNHLSGQLAAIGGGDTNFIDANGTYSYIGAGRGNYIKQKGATIGGGVDNAIRDNYSSILGGEYNVIDPLASAGADRSMIGGGSNNIVSSSYSGIASGDSNLILETSPSTGFEADHSFIGGGYHNRIESEFCVIGGGRKNIISTDKFSSLLGFIGGGDSNSIEIGCHDDVVAGGTHNSNGAGISFMGGGEQNRIHDNSVWNVLVGGKFNWVGYGKAPLSKGVANSTLVGGDSNSVFANNASMIGGHLNVIDTEAHFSTLGGGINNYIHPHAVRSTISGGSFNHILDGGTFAAIPGGDSLIAQSYAQTVMGFNNVAKGSFTQSSNPAGVDDPLVIVGNGHTPSARSNAFEISYDGHSTVFDVNGPIATRTPIRGSRYVDNTPVAWADIGAGGAVLSEFGVTQVASGAPGVYVVALKIKDGSGTTVALSNISVTATLKEDDLQPNDLTHGCGSITVTGLGASWPTIPAPDNSGLFIVRTYDSNCDLDGSRSFEFHVFAR